MQKSMLELIVNELDPRHYFDRINYDEHSYYNLLSNTTFFVVNYVKSFATGGMVGGIIGGSIAAATDNPINEGIEYGAAIGAISFGLGVLVVGSYKYFSAAQRYLSQHAIETDDSTTPRL